MIMAKIQNNTGEYIIKKENGSFDVLQKYDGDGNSILDIIYYLTTFKTYKEALEYITTFI